MIKEKHQKGTESTKEEDDSSIKETGIDVCEKKEDEIGIKQEPSSGPITKNGSILGSTNTGSMQGTLEHKTDSHSEDSVNVSGSDTILLPLKQEECIDGELGGDTFGLGLPNPGGGSNPPPPEGVQPLASNVISKQPISMEVNYMQQQSQIFVFSTVLANSGADEVLQGRYQSIIAYHCAQPGTKKYLEKNPLKVTQFNRQNPAQWLNTLSIMKNKSCARSPGLGPRPPLTLDNFLAPDSLADMVSIDEPNIPWDQKNNRLESLDAAVSNGLSDVPDVDACSPSLLNVQPSLQGVKVPDENLTPQQRQHREVQLATIRKMQQMLFPEGLEGAPQDPNMLPGQTVAAQLEWQKLHQYYDDRKGKPSPAVPVGPVSGTGGSGASNVPVGGNGTLNATRGTSAPGSRLQGPPPPYHLTPRSASVPIALQSPNPMSPNNPTSNLSLPSPRASSALNSPADPNRLFGMMRHMSTGQSPTLQDSPSAPRFNHSSPCTPPSTHHLSPSVTSSSTEPTSNHRTSVDGIFCRTLQSTAQKQQNSISTTSCLTTTTAGIVKEANLMPVPSPQQIQYLNTFEGQELIIQKQPNTSLKEGNISPPTLPTTRDVGFVGNTPDRQQLRNSGSNTPTPAEVGSRFLPNASEECRYQIPSQTPVTLASDKPLPQLSGSGVPGLSPHSVPVPTSDTLQNEIFPASSPHMMDGPRCSVPNTSPGGKMGGGCVRAPPKEKPLDLPNYGCAREDNAAGNPKVSHFDPISSLAQMNQQLTNSVASSLNRQGRQGCLIMNFGSPSMHLMDMRGCHGKGDADAGSGNTMNMSIHSPPHGFHPNSAMGPMRPLSPNLSGAFQSHVPMPRKMGRVPGPNLYNIPNVQVKPNAPNTIQYLPAKSQLGQAPGPRGPPSLEFLSQLGTPLNLVDPKMHSQNLQYVTSYGPNTRPSQGSHMPPHMSHPGGFMSQESMGPIRLGNHIGNGSGHLGPMGGNISMLGGIIPMMRGPLRSPMGLRMPPINFNGPPGRPGVQDSMFNADVGSPSPQMFVSGLKCSPKDIGSPDTTQLPSMGQNNNFKNSPFMGPATGDPNYAEQFHNFQQQLFATSTGNQIGGLVMGPSPGSPHIQEPPPFNPK